MTKTAQITFAAFVVDNRPIARVVESLESVFNCRFSRIIDHPNYESGVTYHSSCFGLSIIVHSEEGEDFTLMQSGTKVLQGYPLEQYEYEWPEDSTLININPYILFLLRLLDSPHWSTGPQATE